MKRVKGITCHFYGHAPSRVITGFRDVDGRALGVCKRCDMPIVLTYYAAPSLMSSINHNAPNNTALNRTKPVTLFAKDAKSAPGIAG